MIFPNYNFYLINIIFIFKRQSTKEGGLSFKRIVFKQQCWWKKTMIWLNFISHVHHTFLYEVYTYLNWNTISCLFLYIGVLYLFLSDCYFRSMVLLCMRISRRRSFDVLGTRVFTTDYHEFFVTLLPRVHDVTQEVRVIRKPKANQNTEGVFGVPPEGDLSGFLKFDRKNDTYFVFYFKNFPTLQMTTVSLSFMRNRHEHVSSSSLVVITSSYHGPRDHRYLTPSSSWDVLFPCPVVGLSWLRQSRRQT